jgi:hypothetical protein
MRSHKHHQCQPTALRVIVLSLVRPQLAPNHTGYCKPGDVNITFKDRQKNKAMKCSMHVIKLSIGNMLMRSFLRGLDASDEHAKLSCE